MKDIKIKGIIFDFDGVIVESADIKTEAFKELFCDYPQKIGKILRYHLENAGISRYVKFRYIYEQILRKELLKDREIGLGERFSQIVQQKILSAPFVAGAKKFLDTYRNSYQFFIASGTPKEELCNIIYLKGLQGYFKAIYGSPKEKIDIINDIIKDYNFAKDEVAYVGDARSDRIAAKQAGIVFIERKANENSSLEDRSRAIRDLSNLREILKRIEAIYCEN